MKDYTNALNYLLKEERTNCLLIQVIKRKSAKILRVEDEGVLIFDKISKSYMLSAKNSDTVLNWFRDLKNCDLFYLTDTHFKDHIQQIYNLNAGINCRQFIYEHKDIKKYESRLNIHHPSVSDLDIIKKSYDKLPEEELDEINKLHNLYVAYDKSQNMVGFIGSHLEGTMGLLEIFPKYRRQGYASELENFMINDFIKKGIAPICHVEVGNNKSIGLQEKLGLTECEENVYWLF